MNDKDNVMKGDKGFIDRSVIMYKKAELLQR